MKRPSRDGDSISTKRLKKFRRLLLTKQDEVLQGATLLEEDTAFGERPRLPDTRTRMASSEGVGLESENAARLMDAKRRLLAKIEEALAKIDAGVYGVCDGDGELIAKSRLEAIPWTRYCAKCARLAQMGLLSSEDSCEGSDNSG